MMNFNGITTTFPKTDEVVLTRKCPFCGKEWSITMKCTDLENGCSQYNNGARIQDAFPMLSPNEREFLMTGICSTCWSNM